MHCLNLSKYGQKDDFNLPRQNLKIVIENTETVSNEYQSDVTMLDLDSVDIDSKENNENKPNDDVSDISDEEYGLEVEVSTDNEIEFHVKLDKPPPSLVVN